MNAATLYQCLHEEGFTQLPLIPSHHFLNANSPGADWKESQERMGLFQLRGTYANCDLTARMKQSDETSLQK